MPEPKKVKRFCPECNAEVELTIDEETGDREGRCSTCKIDVGAIVNRQRYDKAKRKLDEEEAQPPEKKKGSGWL